jgi:1-acyl-sn-glycerol-3-phosphate acyltransferase
MVHKEQMDRPIVGFCVKMLGGFTARTKGKNLDELFDMPLKILKNHGTILIYPEGRINEDAKINPIMTGAAELGLRVSAKYLPVAINGLDYFSLRDIHKSQHV